jgi:hypothetical protein
MVKIKKTLKYTINCIKSCAKDIQEVVDNEKEITFNTFKSRVSDTELRKAGYPIGKNDYSITEDYAVGGFFSSKYKGKPCYMMRWNSVEYIFS